MIAAPETVDHGIDFHRVNAVGAKRESTADVVAGASTDDEYLAEGRLTAVAVEQMGKRVGRRERLPPAPWEA